MAYPQQKASTSTGPRLHDPARNAWGLTGRPMLDVRHLTKRYGAVTAVRDLSFDVHPGEVFGLLGP
jgi:ABC-type glutathione transport system ATPase component